MNHDPTLRALLILLRDPDDPMAAHERRCFARAARMDADRLRVRPMADGPVRPHELAGFDTIFFGGSGAYSVLDDVDWIRWGLDALRRVIDARVPAWASCFGFQGLALALGGEVIHDEDRQEMGATWLRPTPEGRTDPLIGTLPAQGFWAQEGHHDHVTRLPAGVTPLVTGQISPQQAFRVDGVPFWASQFHPELTVRATIERFHHYRHHYTADDDHHRVLAALERGQDTPAVGDLLARLIRGGFGHVDATTAVVPAGRPQDAETGPKPDPSGVI